MKELIFFGLVQGLTEFLPISSSGHLFIFQKILSVSADMLPVFVLMHLATLGSVVVFLYRDIIAALRDRKILIRIFLATLVTGVVALAIEKAALKFFDSPCLIAGGLLITAFLLLTIRKGGARTIADAGIRDSIYIGLLQGLAVFPGISRSGITITVLLKRGFDKKNAFTFSFLLAVPIICLAFMSEAGSLKNSFFAWPELGAGCLAAFLSGLFALKMLKKYLGMDKLYRFGYYCLAVSMAVLFLP